MALTLYRRHKKSCIKGYPQNFRVLRPQTPKERKADCACPIVASGPLPLEARPLKHTTTEETDWDRAEAITKQWEAWGALTNPNPEREGNAVPVTVAEATRAFLEFHGPNGKEWEPSFLQKFEGMFRLRLIPFCEQERIQFIGRFDNEKTVNEFFVSWRNMNPTKNRKPEPSETVAEKPLSYRTKTKELERFRMFCTYCVTNGLLKHNHAKNIKLAYEKPDPKFGLEPAEVEQVFNQIELLEDCHGRLNQRNYLETYAFCLVSRHTGLRISDVARLDGAQLVPRVSGEGWAIQVISQMKTKEWVRIPIPMSVFRALSDLSPKGTKDGKQFWFYTADGTLKTNIKTWRKRITLLFHRAQAPILDEVTKKWTGRYSKPFQNHATPHTWRHTFAISHLNAGTDIKAVSRWLGHSSVTITEAHYGHANRATHAASELAYDESLKRQEEMRQAEMERESRKVVKIA